MGSEMCIRDRDICTLVMGIKFVWSFTDRIKEANKPQTTEIKEALKEATQTEALIESIGALKEATQTEALIESIGAQTEAIRSQTKAILSLIESIGDQKPIQLKRL